MTRAQQVAALIAEGEARLAEAGIPAARLEAEVLLARRLGAGRSRLLLAFDEAASPGVVAKFRSDLEKRAGRYPLQYITGSQEFYSLDFAVDERVLIPRHETEMIVDEVVRRWRGQPCAPAAARDSAGTPCVVPERAGMSPPGARADADRGREAERSAERSAEGRAVPKGPGPVIVDVGTGSGCIAIAIAVNLPSCRVLAMDLSGDAIEVARVNAARHGVADRVEFALGDVLAPAFEAGLAGSIDVIVSNPPYIAEAEMDGLQAELRHEPRIALTPGGDGLSVTIRLLADAARALRSGGSLLVELSIGRAEQARGRLDPALWSEVETLADLQGIPRLLVARRR